MAAMKTLGKILISLFLLGFSVKISMAQEPPSGLDGLDFENPAETTWTLPKELKDISGLALGPDGRLFATEEKRAIIHEIDFVNGTIVKTFSFGRPAAKKDFEGIAITGKRFFLINEKGLLLEGREGFNYEGKVFNAHDTGFGKFCEIEGLAANETKILILCRKPKDKAYKGFLTIFSWDIASKSADQDPFIKMALQGEELPSEIREIEPSGLETLKGGNLLVLSTGKKLILEITPEGGFVGYWTLNKKRHDNPEGIALTPDGNLIIADEGSPATIQVYEPTEN
ncbi:MAG: SdiA-regulated domain-containing protein [Alphaproteobacteria bacterium]